MGKAAFNWDDHPDVADPKDSKTAPGSFNWDEHPDGEAQVSSLESAARGLHQGVTGGFQDELAGVGTGLGDYLFDKFNPDNELPHRDWIDAYRAGRDEARKENLAAKDDHPWIYGGAELTGSMAPAIAMSGIPALEGETLASNVAQGATQGAAMGAGGSEADLTEGDVGGFLKDTAMGTALGAGGGAAGYGLSKAIPKVAGAAGEQLENFANRRAVKAMGGERGTIKKILGPKADVANVENLGSNMMKHDLFDPFTSTEGMVDRTNALKSDSWGRMKAVFEDLDKQNLNSGNMYEGPKGLVSKNSIINDIREKMGSNTDPKELDSLLDMLHRVSPGDNLSMEEAQALKNNFNKTSNWENKLSPTDKNIASRDIESIIRDNIDDAVLKKSDQLPELASAREGYGTGAQAQKLLVNKTARDLGNKTFGLTDYILAAGSLGTHGATIPMVAAKKYGEKWGNQQMALMGSKIGKAIQQNPAFQGFIKSLSEAAKRGPQSLASSMYIMSEQDPDFREFKDAIENDSSQFSGE